MEILLISGSMRAGSTNETLLRTVADLAPEAVRCVFYEGLATLPHFNPDDDRDPLPPSVAALRAVIASADALLFCTPEYAGTLPGSFKNLLDWTVGGIETTDKPSAWINAANPGRGGGASQTLRTVLNYTGAAVVEDACISIPVDKSSVVSGVITDPEARKRIAEALGRLSDAVRP